MGDHTRILLVIILPGLLMSGCATFVDDRRVADRQAAIGQAKKDDQTCVERGHEYPSEAYTYCRKGLLDRREERQLYRFGLMEGEPTDRSLRLTTDRGDFQCRERQWEDTEWIDCRAE